MIVNRKNVRALFAQLLASYLPPTYTIYNYRKSALGAGSPIIMITGGPVNRASRANSQIQISVLVFVMHGDPDSDYTEEDAENLIDDIECSMAGFLESHQKTSVWSALSFARPTDPLRIKTADGIPYLVETITFEVEV